MVRVGLIGFGLAGQAFHAPVIRGVPGMDLVPQLLGYDVDHRHPGGPGRGQRASRPGGDGGVVAEVLDDVGDEVEREESRARLDFVAG